jgi:hypothetical protein
VKECADQIMVIAVGKEERGDGAPNTLTWNGKSAVKNFIGSDEFWFGTGKTALYYLLNPDPGTHDLVITYDKGASVDINLGAYTFCGVAQQAPEAVKAGPEDISVISKTDNAQVVTAISSISATDFTPEGGIIKAWENDSLGMTTALGYYQAGKAGSQACHWNDKQGWGDRSGNVCAVFKAAVDSCRGE